MRKPARKYFSPEAASRSIMLIRSWKVNGATCNQIAGWITSEYAKATDDSTRCHLGLMLCAVYDSELLAETVARKCAELFGLDIITGHSISESALIESIKIHGIPDFQWLNALSDEFEERSLSAIRALRTEKISKSLSIRDSENMFPVDPANRVYALRAIDGSLWLIVFCGSNEDILIDEECFNGMPAVYFTERRHFTSPIWRINTIAVILDYILERSGYTPMQLKKRVVFDGPYVTLLNYEDYRSDKSWDGIDVIVTRKEGSCPAAPPSLSLTERHGEASPEVAMLDNRLLMCLSAVAEILQNHDITKSNTLEKLPLEKWCEELKIFK